MSTETLEIARQCIDPSFEMTGALLRRRDPLLLFGQLLMGERERQGLAPASTPTSALLKTL